MFSQHPSQNAYADVPKPDSIVRIDGLAGLPDLETLDVSDLLHLAPVLKWLPLAKLPKLVRVHSAGQVHTASILRKVSGVKEGDEGDQPLPPLLRLDITVQSASEWKDDFRLDVGVADVLPVKVRVKVPPPESVAEDGTATWTIENQPKPLPWESSLTAHLEMRVKDSEGNVIATVRAQVYDHFARAPAIAKNFLPQELWIGDPSSADWGGKLRLVSKVVSNTNSSKLEQELMNAELALAAVALSPDYTNEFFASATPAREPVACAHRLSGVRGLFASYPSCFAPTMNDWRLANNGPVFFTRAMLPNVRCPLGRCHHSCCSLGTMSFAELHRAKRDLRDRLDDPSQSIVLSVEEVKHGYWLV